MKPSQRSKARRLALQALYQWQYTAAPCEEIDAQFRENHPSKKIDHDYFSGILRGVIQHIVEIDAYIAPVLDRSINTLNPVELAVIRISVYEFIYCLDVPYKVVINEALESTKVFGAQDGFKYVNGVLDKLAQTLRAKEFKA